MVRPYTVGRSNISGPLPIYCNLLVKDLDVTEQVMGYQILFTLQFEVHLTIPIRVVYGQAFLSKDGRHDMPAPAIVVVILRRADRDRSLAGQTAHPEAVNDIGGALGSLPECGWSAYSGIEFSMSPDGVSHAACSRRFGLVGYECQSGCTKQDRQDEERSFR